MKKDLRNGVSIELDDVCFIFSPCYMNFNGDSLISRVELEVNGNNSGITNVYEFNSKEVRIDISPLLKRVMKESRTLTPTEIGEYGYSPRYMNTDIVVSVTSYNGVDGSEFDIVPTIWGGAQYNRTYLGGHMKRKMWASFPYTLPFIVGYGGNIQEQHSSMTSNILLTNNNDIGLFEVNISDAVGTNPLSNVFARGKLVKTFPPFNTLEDSFVSYEIENSSCVDGVYIMWLDAIGIKNYYLFKQKGEVLKVENGEGYSKSFVITSENIDLVDQRNKSAKRILTLAIPKAEKDTYSYVESVLFSPSVWYLDRNNTGNFVKVNVQPGDFEQSGSVLQDFTFKIELPDIYTVKL